jgi:ligand-binding sensor domain-containing protein
LNGAMNIQSLCFYRAGGLWAGTWGKGLIRVHGEQQWHFTTADGLSDDVVTAVVPDPNSTAVWAGTYSGGLHFISSSNLVSYGPGDGLTGHQVRCMFVSGDGRLIVGSDGGGLVRWSGQTFLPVSSPAGIVKNAVRCLTEDRRKRLWAGTTGAGAFCQINGAWLNLSTAEGLVSDVISEIMEDGAGNFWFGSDQGVFEVRAADIESFLAGRSRSVACVLSSHEQGPGAMRIAEGVAGAGRNALVRLAWRIAVGRSAQHQGGAAPQGDH